MLNKPKFMIPSTDIEQRVVNPNSNEIYFSCIVDGNEAIGAWRIKIYRLEDYSSVVDTGKRDLSPPFYPVDNKNRNVVFKQNIKEYIPSSIDIFIRCKEGAYDSNETYYINTSLSFPAIYEIQQITNQGQYDNSLPNLFTKTTLDNIADANPFFWTIEFWSITNETDTPDVSSTEQVFYIEAAPSAQIQYNLVDDENFSDLTEETILTSKQCYFKALCSEGIQLKKYGWRLRDVDGNRTLIDTITKNQVYGTPSNITMQYNGFLNKGRYSIELYLETQLGSHITTQPITFLTKYDTTPLSNDFAVQVLNIEPSVVLDWGDSVVVNGDTYGNCEFVDNYPVEGKSSLKLYDNSGLDYTYGITSDLDIPESSYMVLSTQMPNSDDTTLFRAEGTDNDGNPILRELTYGDGKFNYLIVDNSGTMSEVSVEVYNQPSDQVWYVIILYPHIQNADGTFSAKMTVFENVATGGLYPSVDQYPVEKHNTISDNLYPSFGTWSAYEGGNE